MRLYCLAVMFCAAAAASGKTVTLTLDPKVTGRVLRIEGLTDLPDYAVIEWEVRHESRYSRHDISLELMSTEGHATVLGGAYGARVSLAGWPDGNLEIWVAFQPAAFGTRQPAHITYLYGGSGEKMQGANVSTRSYNSMRRVELIRNVALGRATPRVLLAAEPPGRPVPDNFVPQPELPAVTLAAASTKADGEIAADHLVPDPGPAAVAAALNINAPAARPVVKTAKRVVVTRKPALQAHRRRRTRRHAPAPA